MIAINRREMGTHERKIFSRGNDSLVFFFLRISNTMVGIRTFDKAILYWEKVFLAAKPTYVCTKENDETN